MTGKGGCWGRATHFQLADLIVGQVDHVELVLRGAEVLHGGDLVGAQLDLAVIERVCELRALRDEVGRDPHRSFPPVSPWARAPPRARRGAPSSAALVRRAQQGADPGESPPAALPGAATRRSRVRAPAPLGARRLNPSRCRAVASRAAVAQDARALKTALDEDHQYRPFVDCIDF